ncbi:late competence development ComFB family protein [Leptolyngbya sp. FACHB-36]|uniref:late competence development ComFB family protein n=1 Tax=Leptolyngbya sp. FACHB-36 TaxID=2692808 RepID=UPI0018F04966|nr:late competence development ComFB family protein [Leptolyngbya sp. FACHB-36]
MNTAQTERAQAYRNVMETLVVEEVEKQFKLLPVKLANCLSKVEVIAYALNRLPSLYATSQKGWQQHRSRAHKELSHQVVAAVRQAIAAVRRDPIRSTLPLRADAAQEAQIALQGLKELLRREELSWSTLVNVVEHTLIRTSRGDITWRKQAPAPDTHVWQDARYL